MQDGSSPKFEPAFITPKAERPDVSKCRWHLVTHGADECDRKPYITRRSGPILCLRHQQDIARTAGFISSWESKKNLDERAEAKAAEIVANKDETIAHLRRWLAEERKPERERPRKETAPKVGVVYFLKSNGFMKIGWTSDLDQRLKQYDPDARVLAVKPGTRKDETALHKKFADLKTHRREWFGITPRLMEEVERTVREHGEPPRELNEPVVTRRIVGPRDENYIGGKRKSA